MAKRRTHHEKWGTARTYEPSYCVHLVDQTPYERVGCRLPAVAFRRLLETLGYYAGRVVHDDAVERSTSLLHDTYRIVGSRESQNEAKIAWLAASAMYGSECVLVSAESPAAHVIKSNQSARSDREQR